LRDYAVLLAKVCLPVVLCGALPMAAQAQVHKCTEAGRTVYTDTPCTSTVAPNFSGVKSVPQSSSSLETQIIWNRYPVKGKSYESVLRSLAANGPKGYHGLAGWSVTYHYTVKMEGTLCRFDNVRLKIVGEILLPKWTDEAAAPAALQQRWQGYYAALQQHEEGHVQHGNELAALVREKFFGVSDFACAQAETVAKAEFDRVYTSLKSRDKEYDARTQHGATQGASF
jgi:predicted secreted Zn-dependent protease